MIVYLEPVSGTATANLERARVEMERVVGFGGMAATAKVEGNRIAVTVEINPEWDLLEKEKILNLREWISAKTKVVFRVQSIK